MSQIRESRSKRDEESQQDKKPKKDHWDRLDTLSKAIAALIMPIALAFIGWQVQKVVTTQTTGKDYITIALGILEKKDLPQDMQKNKGLREWAVGLLKYYNPVALSDQSAQELINGEATIQAPLAYTPGVNFTEYVLSGEAAPLPKGVINVTSPNNKLVGVYSKQVMLRYVPRGWPLSRCCRMHAAMNDLVRVIEREDSPLGND